MKKLFTLVAVFGLFLLSHQTVSAAPFMAKNNPQIVANYPTGNHGIVGEPDTHTGADVVMRTGNSGNFQQWFKGTSTETGNPLETDHSVIKLSNNGSCQAGWDKLVPTDASGSNYWGDYLQYGATYCVRTNDSHV